MTYPKLIDLSWCQPTKNIDWQKLHDLGVGVIIRAGQADFTDNLFAEHWENAQKFNVPAGVYYFFQPNMPAAPQLAHFLEIYNGLAVKPKVIFLDVEDIYVGGGQPNVFPSSAAINGTQIAAWLGGLQQATGITGGIYTRADYWDAWSTHSPSWAKYPLWIASWTNYSADVRMPLDWTTWTIWQYEGGSGRQDGVTGPCDLDYFNGTQDEMLAFFGLVPIVPPVEPPVPTLEDRVTALEVEVKRLAQIYQQHFPLVNKS